MKDLLDLDEFEKCELENLLSCRNNFHVTFGSGEYHFIHESIIWDAYVDEIQNIVESCYDHNIPDFVVIDWEGTAQNCIVDGYGHTFAIYDGEELQMDEWYLFRTG